MIHRLRVIDSHTEGEPTRVVIEGLPDLGRGSASDRARVFREEHDDMRRAILAEPRGFDAMVGALLLEPESPDAVAQVVYFNNVSTLHMCVHGTLGVAKTLAHMGRIGPGRHRLETSAGDVTLALTDDGKISVDNVMSWRSQKDVRLQTENHGDVLGDIAWGGNWFFLVHGHDEALRSDRLKELSDFAWDVRRSLERDGLCGDDGLAIDHIEVFGKAVRDDADSKNFVLCPGGEYDRSPCGTGTSAKLACLAADGKLQEGQVWRQESIIGSLFEGRIRHQGKGVIPNVAGGVWITAEATLHFENDDPYRSGIVL